MPKDTYRHRQVSRKALLRRVAERTLQAQVVVETVGDALVAALMEALAEGKSVSWYDFGTFQVKERQVPPAGQQPPFSEGWADKVVQRWVVFHPGKRLKELLRQPPKSQTQRED